jgi:hypothetical protein
MKRFNYGLETVASNSNFYPIHLTSDQLCLLLDCFIDGLQKSNVLIAQVQKSQKKGVEFKIICAKNNNLTDSKNIEKEYTILINPNWSVQTLDHWNSVEMGSRCQELETASETMNKIICEDFISKINKSVEVFVNPIFANDEWVVVRKIKDEVLI